MHLILEKQISKRKKKNKEISEYKHLVKNRVLNSSPLSYNGGLDSYGLKGGTPGFEHHSTA